MDVLLTAEDAFPFATNTYTRVSGGLGTPFFSTFFLQVGVASVEHAGGKRRRGSSGASHRR